MPYTILQSALDDWQGHGVNRYWKSRYLDEITDGVIDSWVAHNAELHDGHAMSGAYIEHLGGAISSVGEDDSAFAHRDAVFDFNALSGWVGPDNADANMSWGRTLWEDLGGVSSSEVYVNNLDNEGTDRVRAAYGPAKYDRLVELKRKFDPDNVFHLNQNIAP
jgi:FAD/FMN-containing dehydrogenase